MEHLITHLELQISALKEHKYNLEHLPQEKTKEEVKKRIKEIEVVIPEFQKGLEIIKTYKYT